MHITLDRNIQYVAEKEIEDAVQKEHAKSGIAVVMNADSGEILALAVRPTYNLNVFQKASAEIRRNHSVADTFEPGSTFKVFLAAAALDLGRVSAGEMFDCRHGLYKYNGSEIHDIVPHKNLSFEDVIIQSSNIGAVRISEKLKKTEFYHDPLCIRIWRVVRLDLPGERPGVLAVPAKWSVLTKANISFGQGITVNSVQLAAAFAAAVNGGSLYKPHLLKRVTNALGETIRENPPHVVRKVIKEATSEKIVDILRGVVEKGTGKTAGISGADVIGKTGTAQKADASGGYSPDKYVVSFIGALMSMKPRLVIYVVLDEPVGKNRTGGKVAAPVFRKIGEAVLSMCGSKPNPPDIILASSLGGFKKPAVVLPRSVTVRKGSKPGEWVVPDLKGLDMRQGT